METEDRREIEAEAPPGAAAEAGVAEALEQARAQWEQESRRRVDEARREAEKLARMTAQERTVHEFEAREAEVSRREREIARREMRAKALEALSERALPGALADALNYQDEEACLKSLDQAERAFRSAVQQGVESRLRGAFPQAGAAMPRGDDMTDTDYYRNHFQNMRGGKKS